MKIRREIEQIKKETFIEHATKPSGIIQLKRRNKSIMHVIFNLEVRHKSLYTVLFVLTELIVWSKINSKLLSCQSLPV